jgi:2-C-methyl-D-erythritol 4-phosphate cytidylyltransferase
MKKAALIVAGGSGTRMGTARPKQFLLLGGKPILIHTIERFLHLDDELPIQLVLPLTDIAFWETDAPQWLNQAEMERVRVCPGGITRTDSVQNGLEALFDHLYPPEEYWVAIHDGVRPFIDAAKLEDAYETAFSEGASVTCVPVKSSMRKQNEDGSSVAVDRSQFFHVQTPQTFRLDQILDAYENRPTGSFTDDASLFQATGEKVVICGGSYDNLKITTPEDLFVAEKVLARFVY